MFQANVFCDELTPPDWMDTGRTRPVNFLNIWRTPVNLGREDLEAMKGCMNEEELQKAERFYQHDDTIRYIIGRGFLRRLIGAYLNLEPKSVELSQNRYNKPLLASHHNFHFNISHAGDWVVFALSNYSTGIDIEPVDLSFAYQEVLPQFFEPSEIGYLAKSASPQRSFFKIWTRKEAFLKATGWGLSDQLNQYCFLDGRQAIPLPEAIEPGDWEVKSFIMDKKYYLSLAFPAAGLQPRFFNWEVLEIHPF